MYVQEALQHVQHACHLCEDKRAMTTALQRTQQQIEPLQLAAVKLYETLIGEVHLRSDQRRPEGLQQRRELLLGGEAVASHGHHLGGIRVRGVQVKLTGACAWNQKHKVLDCKKQ